MKNSCKKVLRVVVDYVQDLITMHQDKNFYEIKSNTPEKDAQALFYLLNGHAFCDYARNGNKYLYCFLFGDSEQDLRVAKYILRSNGIKPRLHLSYYYSEPVLAFRARIFDIENNDKANVFKENLMKLRTEFNIDKNAVRHLEQIKQKVM